MVRLKVYCKDEIAVSKKISIPYGAIKRMDLIADVDGFYTFQFLMVRLKVRLPTYNKIL